MFVPVLRQAAVDDMVAIKHAAGMKDEEVAEAVRERAQRIYDKCVAGGLKS